MRNTKKNLPVITNKIVTNEIKLSNILPQPSRKRKRFFIYLSVSLSLVAILTIAIILLVVL